MKKPNAPEVKRESDPRTEYRGHSTRAPLPPAKFKTADAQPIATLAWVDPKTLNPNDYNPNHQAPPEARLLAVSLLSTGWTQPIVARKDGTIVDGFHRWATACKHPDILAMTGGLVPVIFLPEELTAAEQKEATIRHNRARGKHGIAAMAGIVRDLVENEGLEPADICERLGMEMEEVSRLLDRSGMPNRRAGEDFNRGWVPDDKKTVIKITK